MRDNLLVQWGDYGLRKEGRGLDSEQKKETFLTFTVQAGSEASRTFLVNVFQGKAAGAWSWPLTLSSAGVQNAWGYTPIRQ